MQDEAEGHEDHQHVHLEVEAKVDHIGEDDEIDHFVLELVCYFLGEDRGTMISPSIVLAKKTQVKSRYSRMASPRIML